MKRVSSAFGGAILFWVITNLLTPGIMNTQTQLVVIALGWLMTYAAIKDGK